MKFKAIIITTAFGITACASTHKHQFQDFDPSAKSILLPVGSEEPLGTIKEAFTRNHYRISTYIRDVSETADTAQIGQVSSKSDFRYKLYVNVKPASQISIFCWNMASKIDYELTLVDQVNGGEVFSMAGKGCSAAVAEKFLSHLRVEE